MEINKHYRLVKREYHQNDTIIDLGNNNKIGGGNFAVIAGPCSVENENQIITIAQSVKNSGAVALRGGAFKPRTSPYSFQGMGTDGLELLKIAREKTKLPIVTEIVSEHDLEEFKNDVDIIQIGARNMYNYALLSAVGGLGKKVLLKRGIAATIEELLMAAEYLMLAGTEDIILCERGIRTFETATRNTLDLSAVPILKQKTHLPVIVDPSHGTGYSQLVEPMSLAATAAGADGLLIEVHNAPELALSDGAQSITPVAFDTLMTKVTKIQKMLKEY